MNWYQKTKAPFYNDGKNIAIYEYLSLRKNPGMDSKARFIREISYRLKNKEDLEAMEIAANAMSKQVHSNSVLVPIPSSSGGTSVNLVLAELIADKTGSRVIDVLSRTSPTQPLHQKRKTDGIKGPIDPDYHKMTVVGMDLLSELNKTQSVYLIDNVITSGSTIDAARRTLNLPNAYGLAFSKAGGQL